MIDFPAKKNISKDNQAVGSLVIPQDKINTTGGVRLYYAVTGFNASAATSKNAFDVNVVVSVNITDEITLFCQILSYI